MKALEFVRSLQETLRRDQITAALAALDHEVNEVTITPFQTGVRVLEGRGGFRSRAVQEVGKAFETANRAWGPNYPVLMLRLMEEMPMKVQMILTYIKANFNKDVAPEEMDYRRASVLQYLNALDFFVTYSRHLLLWTIDCETAAAQGNVNERGASTMPQAELEMLQKGLSGFIAVCKLLEIPVSEVDRALKSIPDAAVRSENDEALRQGIGAAKLDPLRMDFIPPRWNPFFHIRAGLAMFSANRYQAAVEEARAIEYSLLNLEQVYAGRTSDPAAVKALEYTRRRLLDKRRQVAKYEEKYLN